MARLGNVGLTIGEELDAQGKLLEDLEEDVDGTTSRLAAAQARGVRSHAGGRAVRAGCARRGVGAHARLCRCPVRSASSRKS